MRAVVLSEQGLLEFREDLREPETADGESLIKISVAGICSTDLELVKGYFGFRGILGHEFVGTVVKSSDSSWVGRRVVSTINFANPCTPEFAEFGYEHHPHRSVLGILNRDGAMADYVAVPTRNLLAVPDAIADEEAVFTEPLAAALRIAEQTLVRPSANVCVVGAGRLGMLIGKVLSLGGSSVTMAARRIESLALPTAWGLQTSLIQELPSDAFDFVVDATGAPEGLKHALRITKPLGTLVLKSTYNGVADVDLTKIVVGEITVVGSRCGPFAPALRLLERHAMHVRSLIDAEYHVTDAIAAFDKAAQPVSAK